MKVVVTGVSGLLGGYVYKECKKRGWNVIGVSRTYGDVKCDLSNKENIYSVCKDADVVFNCIKAAMSTDECEVKKKEAWIANVLIPEYIAKACEQVGAKLVHISSDWVYEGKKGEIYSEESLLYPQNFYSYTKAIAEERVLAYCKSSLVCRTTGLFGFEKRPRNFLYRVLDAWKTGKELVVPADQFSHPISAKELARIICDMVDRKEKGVFNTVSREYLSRYELAKKICDVFGFDVDVKGMERVRKIRIPRYLNLSIEKLLNYGYSPKPIDEQIEELKEEWENGD